MNRAQRRAANRRGNSRKKLGLSVLAATSLVSGNVSLIAPNAFAAACNAADEDALRTAAADLDCTVINVTANIDLAEGAITVNHDVTIQGNFTIDGQGLDRIFEIQNGFYVDAAHTSGDLNTNGSIGVTISDLTLVNGDAYINDGGAIFANYNLGNATTSLPVNLTLDDATFSDNDAAEEGGAIFLDKGSITSLGGTSFTGNLSGYDGGAVYLYDGDFIVTGTTTFANNGYLIGEGEVLNSYTNDGGAIYINSGNFVVQTGATVTFNNNGADGDAGALNVDSGTITIQAGATANFTENFSDAEGGAVYIRGGDFTIAGTATFTDNGFIEDSNGDVLMATRDGGAINTNGTYAEDANLIISGTATFTGNYVTNEYYYGSDGGAIYTDQGDITISGTATFTNNEAEDDGGAIYTDNGYITISGTATFTGNSAFDDGGAIYNDSDDILISGTATFINNYAQTDGGAIYIDNGGFVKISGTASFITNDADSGGAIYIDNGGGTVEVTSTGSATFTGNDANQDGGAIYLEGYYSNFLNFGTAVFTNNNADNDGGAIWAEGDVRLFGGTATFSNNTAGDDGGAIDVSGVYGEGDVVATFTGNTADNSGGAIFAYRVNSYYGSFSFMNNSADYDGGAIRAANITMNSDYFGQNSAARNGGAIFASNQLYVRNSTFFANTAALEGGAIYSDNDTSEVFMTTFVNNQAAAAGDDTPGQSIYTTGRFEIFGNIFASNQSDLAHLGEGGPATPEFVDLGGNLSSSAADESELAHDTSKIVTYAELTLAAAPAVDPNYPNSTRTIQISTDSLAADAIDLEALAESIEQLNLGEGGLPEIDQRGAMRTMKFDAGAYEAGDSTYQVAAPIIEVAPKVVLPAAPQRVAVKKSGAGALRIEWTQPTTSGTGKIVRYEIWRNGKKIATISANARSYRDAGLDSSQSYTYRIVTVGTQGRSIKSVNSQSVFPRR